MAPERLHRDGRRRSRARRVGARRDDRPSGPACTGPSSAPSPLARAHAGHPAGERVLHARALKASQSTTTPMTSSCCRCPAKALAGPRASARAPLRNQKYSAEIGGPGEPVHDLLLRPGDMLYLPRGWLHEALTSDSDSSPHGRRQRRHLAGSLQGALEECGDELGFRQSIGDGDVDELVDVLRGRLTTDAVEHRAAEACPDAAPNPGRSAVPATRRRGARRRYRSRASGDGARSRLELQRLLRADVRGQGGRFPPRIRDEVSWVLERDDPFTAAIAPGDLDDESRLVLVRRLVREESARISTGIAT